MCEQKEKKGKNKSISKKRRKESQVKVKLNFKRKQGKEKHHKKDHPKIIDNIEHDNMPSISVCDTCKISISDAILHCNHALKIIIHTSFILCLIFPINFLTKRFFIQTASTITIHHFIILYQEEATVCLMVAKTL